MIRHAARFHADQRWSNTAAGNPCEFEPDQSIVIRAITQHDRSVGCLVVFDLRHQLLRSLAVVLRASGKRWYAGKTRSRSLSFSRKSVLRGVRAEDDPVRVITSFGWKAEYSAI